MTNEVYIGTPSSPLPYMDENGKLRLLSDDFTYIKIPTMIEGDAQEVQRRVIGHMWRNMSTRGRLNSFLKNLRRRSNNVDADVESRQTFNRRRRANLTLGMPGSGKTYQAKTLGKMVSEEGPIYVNCKDMDLKTLIVQTVLDTSNVDVEKNAIDARIKMYNQGDKTALSEDAVKLLKIMFEDAFTIDENGKIALDWSAAKNNTKYTSADRDKEFVSLLQQFCKREHIEYTHNINSVGFIEKDGPLVEALESGRPIILDEINRGKNQDFLLPYLDFLNGGYDTMDITAANGRVIHLTKDNIPPTFMLEAIGNPETLEMGIKEKMSEPLKDRFDIEQVEDFTPKDFTDMFCTHVAGVPIGIIKEAFNINRDKELAEVCMGIRKMGLTEAECRAIPEDQKTYIKNAAQFLEAAECVGTALYELYKHKKECENSSVCEDPKLRTHIRGQTFSYRIVEDIVSRARTYVPEQPLSARSMFIDLVKGSKEMEMPLGEDTLQMRLERQGEGLEYAIKQITKEMFSCPEANEEISGKVLGAANNILMQNGIGDEVMYEARPLNTGRLKTLFTFTATKRASNEALQIQEMICKLVKDQHPEKSSLSNDEIMDALAIEGFLADIRENPEERHPILGKVLSVNSEKETNRQTPFIENTVVQTLGFTDMPTEKLVDVDDFLATLVIDGVSENNLKNMWTGMRGIYEEVVSAMNGSKEKACDDEVLEVLSGKSKKVNYGAFTLKDNGDKKVILDVFRLPDKGQTLIIGDAIPPATVARLKLKNIKYVNREDANSVKAINDWVNKSKSEDLINKAVKTVNNIVSSSPDIGKELTKSVDKRELKFVSHINNLRVSELERDVDGKSSAKASNEDKFFVIIQNIKDLNKE